MVTSAIKTFTQKVSWKDLDFIVVDMPPGTGDTQLTFSQEIKMDGAIIVSTPQEVALLDVKRGIKMFDKLGVKIIGLVDNMSYFIGDDGKKYNILGEGGVKNSEEDFSKEFLGSFKILTKDFSSRSSKVASIGILPTNSGIRPYLIKSSGSPILSTDSLFFIKFLTLEGLVIFALYQLLFFAATMLVFIQFIKILYFPKTRELFFTKFSKKALEAE